MSGRYRSEAVALGLARTGSLSTPPLTLECRRTHQALKHYEVEFRVLLTGTPLQNNLDELYALLSFILPDVFADAAAWSANFNFDALTEGGAALSKSDELALLVTQLHLIVKPFMVSLPSWIPAELR